MTQLGIGDRAVPGAADPDHQEHSIWRRQVEERRGRQTDTAHGWGWEMLVQLVVSQSC